MSKIVTWQSILHGWQQDLGTQELLPTPVSVDQRFTGNVGMWECDVKQKFFNSKSTENSSRIILGASDL